MGPDDRPSGVLAGFVRLVDLIETLVRHTGRAPRRIEPLPVTRGEWRMPLLCLVSPLGASSPVEVLTDRFESGTRQVPHTVIPNPADDVRSLLHQAYEGLSARRFGGPPLRFRHYGLIKRIMDVDLSKAEVEKRPRELARRLGRSLWTRPREAGQVATGSLGLVLWISAALVPMMLPLLVTGRMRWFMRQPFLAPRLAGGLFGFFAFAVRLTTPARRSEDGEQIDRLLVHAFLEDLRTAYRHRPWRPSRWRRTTYPVLLLDRIVPGDAAYDLLRLVNTVRNETGESDPLLIISHGGEVPPGGSRPEDEPHRVVRLEDVGDVFRVWHGSVTEMRQARDDTAWYVPIEIPPADLGAIQPRLPRIVPPPVPLRARPAIWIALALVPCLCAGTWYGLDQRQEHQRHERAVAIAAERRRDLIQAHCYPVNTRGRRIAVTLEQRECIGYSDSDGLVFGDNQKTVAIQKTIFEQNRYAEQGWAVRNDRPYATLVYLNTLTRLDPLADDETFVAEREGLEGVATAQYRANLEADNDPASPYVRIIVANAGQEARQADQVVRMLEQLIAGDSTVLAVVAPVDSRRSTQRALRELERIGLPTVTPTTSADGISGGSSLYLQLAAPNIDQARLVHHYVTEVLHRRGLVNYYTFGVAGRSGEQDDLYVQTLRDDLKSLFKGDYADQFWKNGTSVRDICARRFSGVVFFGGRYSEFGPFIQQVYSECSQDLPVIVADDSVGRYMANVPARATAPTNLPVIFAVKGQLASCPMLEKASDSERQYFLTDLRTQRSRCRGDNPQGIGDDPVGGWTGLSYDAVRIVAKAVKDIAGSRPTSTHWDPRQISPQLVYRQVRQSADQTPYPGVTGPIRFDRYGVAEDKRLSLLCAPNVYQVYRKGSDIPREVDRIGVGYRDDPPLRSGACHAN
ncbi:hypothetical protein [Actinoallomurus vinaceus]|uniref:hypothetical protein n=1 Tax=Actinoallomurus vinaceus TaxID=1080074 RepID=UPI0031EA7591